MKLKIALLTTSLLFAAQTVSAVEFKLQPEISLSDLISMQFVAQQQAQERMFGAQPGFINDIMPADYTPGSNQHLEEIGKKFKGMRVTLN
ncbi:MAG: hypothetical protein OEZ58_15185 [Gammaproteobacteria bacterium]|nr:hypothetical protein [Gammaproteobacteria bacterium]MDH5730339.1 hypothetical protein [Gammaproteobacteria bacterium]